MSLKEIRIDFWVLALNTRMEKAEKMSVPQVLVFEIDLLVELALEE